MQFCGSGQRSQRRDVHQLAIPTSRQLRRILMSLFPAGWHLSGGDVSYASPVQAIEVIKPALADDARMLGRIECDNTILKRLPGFGCGRSFRRTRGLTAPVKKMRRMPAWDRVHNLGTFRCSAFYGQQGSLAVLSPKRIKQSTREAPWCLT